MFGIFFRAQPSIFMLLLYFYFIPNTELFGANFMRTDVFQTTLLLARILLTHLPSISYKNMTTIN